MNVRSCATVTAIAVAIFGCGYAANSLRDAAANQMQPRAEAVKYFTNTSRVILSNDTFVNITECHPLIVKQKIQLSNVSTVKILERYKP